MNRWMCMSVVAGLCVSSVSFAQASEGRLKAIAKKEMRECLADAEPSNWDMESSVSTVGNCLVDGSLRDVNFYLSYPCRPNQVCPRVADRLVATVSFGCDDEILYAQCWANTCIDNSQCSSDSWCRQTEYGHSECTPYVGDGESCGGYVLPWTYEQCEPGLVCTTDPFIPDLSGVCATCDYNGTGYAAGESWTSDDGCNTCFCGEDGSIGCTKRACL